MEPDNDYYHDAGIIQKLSTLVCRRSKCNVLFLLIVVLFLYAYQDMNWGIEGIQAFFLLGGYIILLLVHKRTTEQVKILLHEVEQEWSIKALPILFQILRAKQYDWCHGNSLFMTLTLLLERLTSQDTYLLKREDVLFMNQTLSVDHNNQLLLPVEYSFRKTATENYLSIMNNLHLAMIRTLPEVGNEQSLKVLQSIIKRKTDTPRSEALKEAAMGAIPLLQQRLEAIKMRETLLRPAALEESDKELLRPSTYTEDSPAEVLLRPSTPQPPDA